MIAYKGVLRLLVKGLLVMLYRICVFFKVKLDIPEIIVHGE